MKRWKKYALCLTCLCFMGLLTGCGNRSNNNTTETNTAETNTAADGNDTKDIKEDPNRTDGNAVDDTMDGTIVGENGADSNQAAEGITGDTAGDGMTEDENGMVNDVTDPNGTENGGNLGDAGADIIDGVGDAGKDIIDGVENAGDELTGNDNNRNNDNNA